MTHKTKMLRTRQQNCDLCFPQFRMSVHWHNNTYFTLKIATSDGRTIADGDRWDLEVALNRAGGGSPLERLTRAARRLLADPNRAYPVRSA